MSLFTTTERTTPSIRNIPSLPETDESRFEKNLIALHAVERELAEAWQAVAAHRRTFKDGRAALLGGKLYARVNALAYDPALQILESNLAAVSRKRTQLYAEHSRLKILTVRTR